MNNDNDQPEAVPGSADALDAGLLEQAQRLEAEAAELRTQLNDNEEQLVRSLADLQNVRRRANEERIRLPQQGAENLLAALLPSLDTLELALKNKPAEATDWTRGVETVFAQLLTALQSQGVERIEQTGIPADPEVHEVLTAEDGGGETVVEILQTGYKLNDKTVRPAKVKVGNG